MSPAHHHARLASAATLVRSLNVELHRRAPLRSSFTVELHSSQASLSSFTPVKPPNASSSSSSRSNAYFGEYQAKEKLASIFDEETKVENVIIKSSRWHCTKSFIDPVQSCEDQSRSSGSAAETSTDLLDKKTSSKKSS